MLRVQGKLKLEQLEPLRTRLQSAWRSRPARLILEFSECPFVDSAGIAVVVGAHKHAREVGIGFILVGVGAQFHSALRILRLSEVFDIRPDVEAALAG